MYVTFGNSLGNPSTSIKQNQKKKKIQNSSQISQSNAPASRKHLHERLCIGLHAKVIPPAPWLGMRIPS